MKNKNRNTIKSLATDDAFLYKIKQSILSGDTSLALTSIDSWREEIAKQTNTITQNLNQNLQLKIDSVYSSSIFFDSVYEHIELLDTEPIYSKASKSLMFGEGEILNLKVKVIDSRLTPYLYRWQYQNNAIKTPTPFGCELLEINTIKK